MTDSGELPPVVRWRERVYVGARRVADGPLPYGPRRRVEAVRERTSDDWWRMAAAIVEADEPDNTGGPLGLGVDFFAYEHGAAIPPDVRQAIQEDAYEAAREVIVRGIEEHLARVAPAAAALADLGVDQP